MSGLILLLVALVVLVLIGYLFGVLIRRKNDGWIARVEEQKDRLFALPLPQDIEKVDHLHLVGQSLDEFEVWREKWASLSIDVFPKLEAALEEAALFNDTFRFLKVKQLLTQLEEDLLAAEQAVKDLQSGLAVLSEQEDVNTARVKYALDMYEELEQHIQNQSAQMGTALSEINKQLSNIQAEFSQFVQLNSSGDPLEAADVLERAEEHTIALGQISEQVPALAEVLEIQLPDKLDDLETGYARLLEEGYHFGDQPIESRFQTVRESLAVSKSGLAALELDKVEADIADMEDRLTALYDLFEKEIQAQRQVKRSVRIIPPYLEHTKANQSKLQDEILRLSQAYILDDAQTASLKAMARELDKIEQEVLPGLTEEELPEQPFTVLETVYGNTVKTLEQVEKDQLALADLLQTVESHVAEIRLFNDRTINQLHIIKRFMEKRRLPGIPEEFMTIFFSTSSQAEDLMKELDRVRLDIKMITKLAESTEKAMLLLEETTYSVVQYATLTEQLLQYSNRYRSFDTNIQASFDVALHLFEVSHDYRGAFDEIAYALELVEPGVTERFVTSYEKTREIIRF